MKGNAASVANAIKGLDASNERKSRVRGKLSEMDFCLLWVKFSKDKCLRALSVKIFMRTARLPVSDRTIDGQIGQIGQTIGQLADRQDDLTF